MMFKKLERVVFFPGKLLTADDLNAEQQYQLDLRRRHNQSLHGFGIVEGLRVEIDALLKGAELIVSSGMALDCLGREIVLEQEIRMALSRPREKEIYLGISFVEETIDVSPSLSEQPRESADARDITRFKESHHIEFFPEDPCSHDKKKTNFPKTCGQPHATTLARLIEKKGTWEVDRTFRRKFPR